MTLQGATGVDATSGFGRLPAHHVPRRRLTDSLRDERVVVIEASAGYGKSVLGVELVEAWGAVPIDVLLEEGRVSVQLLVSRLRASVRRAGFVDAAAAMADAADDPAAAIDAMLAALSGESCAIVIDDAHHAMRDAAVMIDRIAIRVSAPQRLIVAARQLPAGSERLRRADAAHLGAPDLALRPAETVELCRSGFGLEVSADEGRRLDEATGGWTAATVLAASRAKRTSQSITSVIGSASAFGSAGEALSPVATILDELVAALGRHSSVLANLAPLPLLDRDLLGAVTGEDGFFDRVLGLGLPLSPVPGGWWQLPGPVRDHLATLGAPDLPALVKAASYYEERGELGVALQMLLAAGESEAAAQLLAGSDPRRTEAIDALELLAVLGRIPDEVLDRHPRARFQVGRSCGPAAFLAPRAQLMAQLDNSVREQDDPRLRRAIDAELATDLINGDHPADAFPVARRILASATSDEQLTRARALTVMGQATCFRRDDAGTLSDDVLREAAGYFDQAIKIYLALGYGEAVNGPAIEWAIRVELGRGRPQAALAVLDRAATQVAGKPRRLAPTLFYRAQVLSELGRHEESEATLDEVLRLASQTPGSHMIALVHWERMSLASMRGDPTAAVDHATQVEADAGDWWTALGVEFMAEASDCLDRVGHTAAASRYLERARAEGPNQRAEPLIAMAEGALLARHGDPVVAEARLVEVQHHGIPPRERWRVTLLRAYAAWRCGDPSAGSLAARAFEQAALLGQPQLPLIRERELTESLMALAVDTGSAAAAALDASSLPVSLSLFGAFDVTSGGRPVPIGTGQAAQLLKMVAVSGGRLHAEQAIEALWPETEPLAGRNRLRTVLARLKDATGEIVRREGELLALDTSVRVDFALFDREQKQALALRAGDPGAALAVARSAIARYRGDLLPHDPYESWAEQPRQAARRAMLDLLELVAIAAAERQDLDEAKRMVVRSLELDPYEDCFSRIAQILLEKGRRGAALSVLRHARSVLAPLGIDVPLDLPGTEKTVAA